MNDFLVIGEILWVHKDGRTFAVPLSETKNFAAQGARTAASGIINSPMPGKILKLNSAEGQNVSEGETLCVLEAMKMEYALKAPFKGRVKSVKKKAGEQVSLGETIVVIE